MTINPRPITVTAAASSKVYDSTTNSTAIPAITTGTLAYTDTPAFTETYDNKNVGTTHVMTPAGTVNDGNGGKNYTVTFITINTGVITAAPLTITATTNTKTYDGTTSAAAIPAVSGLKGSTDAVTGLVETYNTSNAGTNLVLTVSAGYTVNDGNGGKNYTVTTATNNTGVINKAPVTASITASNKTYDGTTTATITVCSLTGVLAVDTGNVTCSASGGTFASANAGISTVTATVTLAGAAAGNYALTSASPTTSATINPAPVTVTLTNLMQTYTGGSLMPTVTTSPTGVPVSLTGAPDMNAGSYPVTVTVSNNPNYTGSASGTFVIAPASLTITATTNTKAFDGTPTAAAAPTVIGLKGSDTVTGLTETYNTIGPGTNLMLTVSAGFTVNDGNNGNNYIVTTAGNNTGVITDNINLMALSLNGVNYGSNTPASPVWVTGNPNELQLTNAATETASAWLATAIPVSSAFTTTFQFQISPSYPANTIADGFAFVIQGASTGNTTLGTAGMGAYIGYTGIPNSIAVEFDTYQNSDYGDPASPHIGIQSLGTSPNTSDHNTSGANLGGPTVVTFADGNVHTATIKYDGTATAQRLSR